MKKDKIELIIVKFLNNEASHEDLVTLDFWLRHEKNKATFNQFVKTEYLTMASMDEFDLEKAKLSIKKKIKTNKRTQSIKQFTRYAAAAIIIGFISIPFFIKNANINLNNTPAISNGLIKSGTNKATLTLNNGKEIPLHEGETYSSDYLNSDGTNLIYNKKVNDQPKEIAYNYLTIPRGGQYALVLPDGTKVWINSDSKIKYPTRFVKGKPRQVELVYGEAYFEVTPSNENEGSKFMVHSRTQDIEVLGTKFNIKAYLDEYSIYTTLVEGSITVSSQGETELLTPNHQSIINIGSSKITITDANIPESIAWKDGIFSFKNMPLKQMMKILSRWYNTEVTFSNPEIELIEFTGVLGKDQNIEDILSIITNSNNIAYEIKNNTIIFK